MKTILLYIVWVLAGGGPVAVAVGYSDIWQVTRDKWHMTQGYKKNLIRKSYYSNYATRLGINHFFVNSENSGIKIWRKKCVNYDKIKIALDCVNQIFNPNAFFFFATQLETQPLAAVNSIPGSSKLKPLQRQTQPQCHSNTPLLVHCLVYSAALHCTLHWLCSTVQSKA